MKALGIGDGMGDGTLGGTETAAGDGGGVAWTRHTFAIGPLTRRSAEIRMVRQEGGAAAAVALKALVGSRVRRGTATVH